MARHDMIVIIKRNIVELYEDMLDTLGIVRSVYIKPILIGFLLLCVLGISYGGYRWYENYLDRTAQYAYSTILDAYIKAQEKQEKSESDFSSIASQAAVGYQKYKRSSLALLFVMLQVDALLKNGQKEEARDLMNSYAPQMQKNNPIAPIFKTKHALLLLDSADEAMQRIGLESLQVLAHDVRNVYRDGALYHLFNYYWIHDEIAHACVVSREFSDAYREEMGAPSPWLDGVVSKTESLGI